MENITGGDVLKINEVLEYLRHIIMLNRPKCKIGLSKKRKREKEDFMQFDWAIKRELTWREIEFYRA